MSYLHKSTFNMSVTTKISKKIRNLSITLNQIQNIIKTLSNTKISPLKKKICFRVQQHYGSHQTEWVRNPSTRTCKSHSLILFNPSWRKLFWSISNLMEKFALATRQRLSTEAGTRVTLAGTVYLWFWGRSKSNSVPYFFMEPKLFGLFLLGSSVLASATKRV